MPFQKFLLKAHHLLIDFSTKKFLCKIFACVVSANYVQSICAHPFDAFALYLSFLSPVLSAFFSLPFSPFPLAFLILSQFSSSPPNLVISRGQSVRVSCTEKPKMWVRFFSSSFPGPGDNTFPRIFRDYFSASEPISHFRKAF